MLSVKHVVAATVLAAGIGVASASAGAWSSDSDVAAIPVAASARVHEISLRGAIDDLLVGADGMVRTSTSYANYETRSQRPIIQRVSPSGKQLSSLRLLPRSTKTVIYSNPASALLPDGAVVAYQRSMGENQAQDYLPAHSRVRTLAANGKVLADDPITMQGGGEEPSPNSMVTGPTGAAALLVSVHSDADDFANQGVAFKPAGSATFGVAVPVSDFGADEGGVEVVLGPDGGGALIVVPWLASPDRQPFVRRISPTGAVGEPKSLPVTPGMAFDIGASFSPSGALLIALSGSVPVRGETAGPGVLFVSTLAAQSDAPSVPVKVPGSQDSGGGDWPGVAFGPGDRAVVVTPRRPSGLRIFEGTGNQLHQTAEVASSRWTDVRALFSSDGALSVLWTPQEGPLSGRVYGLHRSAAGSFGKPRALTPRHAGGVSLVGAAQKGDGRAVLVYQGTRKNYLVTVRP